MTEEDLKRYIRETIADDAKSKLSENEKIERAREMAEFCYEGAASAESRSTDVSNEFIKLEVQIATLLFAFIGFFMGSFTELHSTLNVFWVKVIFSLGVASLILSLLMGLLHLKMEESFWDQRLSHRNMRFMKWIDVRKKRTSFEEAESFQEGTAGGKGHIINPPKWTWIMQSIFLGFGITILFILFIAHIFNNVPVAV